MSWCTDNLSPERRREIAEQVIASSGTGKVTSRENSRAELIGLCPLHEESNPSFSYNYGKDVFNCSGCQTAGDLIELYTQVMGLDQKTGFKRFIAEYAPDLARSGKAGPKPAKPKPGLKVVKPPKVIPEDRWTALKPLSDAMITQLVHTRGWSREIIAKLDLKQIFTGDTARVAIPIRDKQGRLLNIRKYSPGAAENKVLSEKGHGETRWWPVGMES
jgi:putative DNA primase/helicase